MAVLKFNTPRASNQPPAQPASLWDRLRNAFKPTANANNPAAVAAKYSTPASQWEQMKNNWNRSVAKGQPAAAPAPTGNWTQDMTARARAQNAAAATDPRNNPAYWRGNANTAAQAGQRYQENNPGQQGIYGVHYGDNWTRSNYVPPVDWRMGEGAPMQMSNQEYQMRKNAWDRAYSPSYQNWMADAAEYRGPHWIGSTWSNENPRPASIWQTQQEYILRQNVAPPGKLYQPYGSTYYPKPTLPAPTTNQDTGAGGYGYGDWGYGGGGGGGGSSRINEFWNAMTNWNINRPQGG